MARKTKAQAAAEAEAERTTKATVLRWMREHAEHHDNATSLAEDAAHNALAEDHDAWLNDEQHWIWELAIRVIPGE